MKRLKHTSKGIKSLLKDLNLETKKGTDHYSELIWETGKINNLFTKITVLSVPTVTPKANNTPENIENTVNYADKDKNAEFIDLESEELEVVG